MSQSQNNNDVLANKLQHCSNELIGYLQAGDFDTASALIQELADARNNEILTSVGSLTRGLHEAIKNFNVDADIEKSSDASGISDASDRLQYVLDLTQAAADKTMDKVESVAPLASDLGNESAHLQREWQRLKCREISKDEFKTLYLRVEEFLNKMSTGTSLLSNGLQEIILEQGFQDLTGQVLKKVIDLVRDVEQELVQLLKIACQVEEEAGLTKPIEQPELLHTPSDTVAEGPQIHAEKRADVMSNQDDVDNLLSSLGF